MPRNKHIWNDGKGNVWNTPCNEKGEPLISKINPKKPTKKAATSKPQNPFR
jgi:hypothetical protein